MTYEINTKVLPGCQNLIQTWRQWKHQKQHLMLNPKRSYVAGSLRHVCVTCKPIITRRLDKWNLVSWEMVDTRKHDGLCGALPSGEWQKHMLMKLHLLFWTNCAFGLYPSSGVSKNWGIKNIDKISQYTSPQNSHKDQLLTTEQLTGVGLASRVYVCMHSG
jgi:hypothetical protein